MKKQLQLIGIISAIALFIGVIFKSQHFPGTGVLLSLGTLLGVIYLLVYLGKGMPQLKNGLEKSAALITVLAILVVLIGFLFKTQHWPGANIILILSHLLLLIAGITLLIDAYKENDEKTSSLKALMSFSIFILMIILLFLGVATGALPVL